MAWITWLLTWHLFSRPHPFSHGSQAPVWTHCSPTHGQPCLSRWQAGVRRGPNDSFSKTMETLGVSKGCGVGTPLYSHLLYGRSSPLSRVAFLFLIPSLLSSLLPTVPTVSAYPGECLYQGHIPDDSVSLICVQSCLNRYFSCL